MEKLRLEESQLKKLKKELKNSEIVGDVLGKATNLRGELAIAEKRINSLEAELKDYQVLPEYRHIESEASSLARQLAELSDRNTADKRLIADLSETLEVEQSPSVDNLERLYASAGVQLPDVSLKRLESVKEFHKAVVRNRKAHLQGEINAADIKVKKATNHQKLVNDFEERDERLKEAILLFEELSGTLSERSAVLVVEPKEKGLELDIQGAPIRSTGIREQQIFCFDMLLAVMQQRHSFGLDFLVHDSRLFDAMDARQVANAFEAVVKLTEQHGFQYIVTMNSDDVPLNEFSADFDFESHVLPQRLSDKTEDGGLFGFRFV